MLSNSREKWEYLASVAFAVFEHARVVVCGHVPRAAERVVDVLAQLRRPGAVFAPANAELVVRNKVGPLVQLLELAERA